VGECLLKLFNSILYEYRYRLLEYTCIPQVEYLIFKIPGGVGVHWEKTIYEFWCDERLNVKTLKLRDLHVSHTLGCVGDWNTLLVTDKTRAK
jgi:hypothetical protein